MTARAESAGSPRVDLRTILGGGGKLGAITAAGVAGFALFSRPTSGMLETLVQCLLVLAGGIVFSFAPALWIRPKDVDSIAWASLVGLLGALSFTVLDVVLLRPIGVYHWTWDEIGGGSGFWYLPVWWMGSATLAWLGAWIYSRSAPFDQQQTASLVGKTTAITVVCFIGIAVLGFGFNAAALALAFTAALVVHTALAVARRRP